MEGGTKIKANRSSIIRIIISNYDSNGIKEIKVRYNKQAQLDTFLIESKLEKGVFTLKDVKWKAKEKNRYNIIREEIIDNSVKITKIDKLSNKAIRGYIIKFSVSPKNKNVVVVDIKDCIEHNLTIKGERSNTRRDTSQTERKLLSKETQTSYSKIACCPPENIDSLKIYKIKRYLSYRSNMLLFFSLINDFICEGIKEEKIVELYKITSKVDKSIIEERVTKIAQYLRENLSNELENYNNGIEKTISKKSNSINDCNNRIESCKKKIKKLDKIKDKKQIRNLERIIQDSENKIKEYSKIIAEKEKERLVALAEDKIKEDVYKILELYSDLRHKLAHYNYAYFENLFENNIEDSNMVNMAKLLDLNIFKYLELSKKLRIENKTNYLDDDTKFSILGVRGKAKKYYSIYNTLCEQKNGFNTFINNFFTKDGIEDIDFKDKVNARFKEEIKELEEFEAKQKEKKKKFKDKELELLKEQDTELETAYVWDIHNSIRYKGFYKDRKDIVEKYNQTLSGNRNKIALRDYGAKLLEIKNKMDNITKRNSIIRLKYKLQVAYAFLMKEFNGNIARFKSEFDVSNVEQVEKYQAHKKEYLCYTDKKNFNIEKFQEILGELEASNKVTWLSSDTKNNLFKFYVLTYILLPFEFKGDFLGFVKKHYYDIKNVEYLDENNEELTNEQLEKMKDDSFFNKIRLFEKNSKKYNIFSKSFLTNERVKEYFEKLNIGAKHYEYVGANGETKGIFNKNIIIPIFKYYQIIIKLYNDVEIAILLYLSKLKGDIPIDEVIDKVTQKQSITEGRELDFYSLNGLFGFFKLINDNLAEFDTTEKIPKDYLKSEVTFIRNKVFHFDYKNFIDNLLEIDCENGSKFSVSTEIGKLRKFIQDNLDKLTEVNLDYNFLNDYYMKKEQFIFGQLKQIDYTITNKEEKEQVAKNKNLLGICNLFLKGNDIEVINKIYEKYEILKKISDSPEIKNYDEIIPNGIKLNEIRYIKKELEKKSKNENYRLNIDRIKEEIGKCSSDLLGLYKQQIITLLKRKIIEKIQYKEEKILTIFTYEIETKHKKTYTILLARKNSSDNFYFLERSPNQKQINIGDKTILKLEIGTLDKDKNRENKYNLYLSLNKNAKGKKVFKREVIDLRQHYLFTEEIKFKDLK